MAPADAISWSAARRVADRVLPREHFSQSYLREGVDAELVDVTRQAEGIAESVTGLIAPSRADVLPVSRHQWVAVNIASARRLLSPLSDAMSRRRRSAASAVGSVVSGSEVGAVLGWMSGRVLGQYDPLLHPESMDRQDVLYYVVPNVLEMEKRYAFPPRQFRLWVAVHECTHRLQFWSAPWVGPHLRATIGMLIDSFSAEPRALSDMAKNVADGLRDRDGRRGGVATLALSPEQRKIVDDLAGMMALFEGHAEVAMSRIDPSIAPDIERFHRVVRERRRQRGAAGALQRLLGIDAKLRQYADGERFVRAVDAAGGTSLLNEVWSGPSMLPSLQEVREPERWLQRARGSSV